MALGTRDLLADLAPTSHHDGAIGDFGHVIHRVGDHDHRMAVVTETADEVEDAARLTHAERRGGLVEDDDLGRERGSSRDSDDLTLAA